MGRLVETSIYFDARLRKMAGCWKTRPVDHSTFHLRSAISRRWCLMSFLFLPSFSRTHTHTQNTYKHRHTWTHARIVVCWLFMVADSLRLLFISCSHQSPESCPAFRLFHCSPVHFIILSSVLFFPKCTSVCFPCPCSSFLWFYPRNIMSRLRVPQRCGIPEPIPYFHTESSHDLKC